MFKNNLKIALRFLFKRNAISVINIFGLAVGISACFLIMQYVYFENSYDKFNQNAADLYRVPIAYSGSFGSLGKQATNHPALGPAMQRDFPEVVNFARVVKASLFSRSVALGRIDESGNEKSFIEDHIYFADSSFLTMFTFPFVMGNPSKALVDPGTMVISQTTARKYFGDEDPMGKTLSVNNKIPLKITGVFKDVPENSHIKFDVLISFVIVNPGDDNWKWPEFYTYVQLAPGIDPKQVENKFPGFIDKYLGDIQKQYNFQSHFSLQPITDIHLHSDCQNEPEPTGSASAVYFLIILAFFILIIAWVNYINLTTAKSMERAKEVGFRKVIGATKRQLIMQFMTESFALNMIAFVIGIIMAGFGLPYFNELVGKNLGGNFFDLGLIHETIFWIIALLILISGAFLAGVYPAWRLSSYHPSQVLKGKFHGSRSGILIRKLLIIFQFVISSAMIAGTLTVYRQMTYMNTQDLGYDKDQIMVINSSTLGQSVNAATISSFKSELLQLPLIHSVSGSSDIPGQILNKNSIRNLGQEREENITTFITMVDPDFFKTYGMPLSAGRYFNQQDSSEITNGARNYVLVNKKLSEELQFEKPEDAVGKSVIFDFRTTSVKAEIVGVLKNYHQKSFREEYLPILYLYPNFNDWDYFSLNINVNQLPETIKKISETYQNVYTGNPFSYFFLDDFFANQYKADQQFKKVFTAFSTLAIIVACVGLLGLSMLVMTQRKKEIGIRKVLGAKSSQIAYMLSNEFIHLLIIGYLIAVPVFIFWSSQWLDSFAFHIHLDWTNFVIPFIVLYLISVITIGYHAIRSAFENPIDSIRYE